MLQVLGEKIREIVSQFRGRANQAKLRLQHPPSPESLTDVEEDIVTKGGGDGGKRGGTRRRPSAVAFEVRLLTYRRYSVLFNGYIIEQMCDG